MKMHELKTINPYFADTYHGNKLFEIRKDDRDFCIGDILWLREYDADAKVYSGRSILCKVMYRLPATIFEGLSIGYCAMGIHILEVRCEE